MSPEEFERAVASMETLRNRVAVLEKVGAVFPMSSRQVWVFMACLVTTAAATAFTAFYVRFEAARLSVVTNGIYSLLSEAYEQGPGPVAPPPGGEEEETKAGKADKKD